MDIPEVIKHHKKILAIVFRKGIEGDPGVHFYTPTDAPFQAGIHNREGGVKLPPHIHTMENPLTITSIHEVLVVLSGAIRVRLYTPKRTLHTRVDLCGGESILLMEGGHGCEFLKKTTLLEIKQGPYMGSANAKLFIQE